MKCVHVKEEGHAIFVLARAIHLPRDDLLWSSQQAESHMSTNSEPVNTHNLSRKCGKLTAMKIQLLSIVMKHAAYFDYNLEVLNSIQAITS